METKRKISEPDGEQTDLRHHDKMAKHSSNLNYGTKGFWTTHVSLPVELGDCLNKFVDGLIESVAADYNSDQERSDIKITKLDEFHVTLSKTFQLKQSAASQLVKSFESEFQAANDAARQKRFSLDAIKILPGKNFQNVAAADEIEEASYYENKTFLAFELAVCSNEPVLTEDTASQPVHNCLSFLTEKLVKCFKENKLSAGNIFNQKNYLYHVSVAWINQSLDKLDKALLERLVSDFKEKFKARGPTEWSDQVEIVRLKLKIGNKLHFYSI